MSMIQLFNRNISSKINTDDVAYQTWIGADPFTPEITIVDSGDFNCGAVCNELEFARTVTDYTVASLSIDDADDNELNEVINGFIDLPRRGAVEADELFRNRFKFLTVEQANARRTTKWAILDAVSYFVSDMTRVQLIEPWDNQPNGCYFQLRFEGVELDSSDVLYLDSDVTGFLDQYYLGGASLGEIITYLEELVIRVKAAGVDFDIIFVNQDRFTLDSDAFIGIIQKYLDSDAVILAINGFTSNSDATIV